MSSKKSKKKCGLAEILLALNENQRILLQVTIAATYIAAMEWTPERIRALRLHIGDLQREFAERVGMSRLHTVSDWEAGRSTPTGSVCKLLDYIADDHGFTERVARRVQANMKSGGD